MVVVDAFIKDRDEHDWTFLLHGTAASRFESGDGRATHTNGAAVLDIVPCYADKDVEPGFSVTRFPSNNFGEHPLLRVSVSGRKEWVAATVLFPRRADDEPVQVERSVRRGVLTVVVTRGDRADTFTLTRDRRSGRVKKLRVLRKHLTTTVEKLDLRPR